MQLDLTPSVLEEGEESATEGGDGERVQKEPARGGVGVEASGSTSRAAGPDGEQQQGKAKTHTLPQMRKPKGVVMRGWETPVSRPGRTCMATMKLTAGADVAEQQLGNGEALLILPHGYDTDEEDEPACCFVAPVLRESTSMEEALAGPDREKWLISRDAEYQSLLENGTCDLVVLRKGKKAVQCKWAPRCWYQNLAAVLEEMGFRASSCDEGLFLKGEGEKLVLFLVYLDDILVFSSSMKEIQKVQQQLMKNFKYKTLGEVKYYLGMHMERDLDHRWLKLHEEKFIKELGEKYGIENERKVATPLPAEFKLVKVAEDEGVEAEEQQKFQSLVLEEIGFTPSTADHSLFMLGEGERRSFMVVYVDDILIFSPSSDLVKEVMLKLQDKFKCKALGDVSFYLGLHIECDVEKRCMQVHQRKYLEALAANFGQSEGHVATPFPSGLKCVKGPEEESVGEEERRRFHSLVGSLMYAAVNTRPDVAFATEQLARVVQCPNEEQVAAGMRVAKYLGQTATVGLQFSAAAQRRQKSADGVEPGRLFLTAFSDASYASEPEDTTSVGGFICCVGGGPTAWESKKQVDQALSSVESEYMAHFRAVREIV
ncbi:unnamed protein product [Closterium sp. NIES-54]